MEKAVSEIDREKLSDERQRLHMLFISTLLLIAFLGAAFIITTGARAESLELARNTQDVRDTLTKIDTAFRDADIEGRDAILYSRSNPEIDNYRGIVKQNILRFQELTAESSRQQENALLLASTTERRFTTNDYLIELSKNKGVIVTTDYMKANHSLDEVRRVSAVLKASQDEESRIYEDHRNLNQVYRERLAYIGIAVIISLVGVWGISYYYIVKHFNSKTRAAQVFFDALQGARTGTDGLVGLPIDIAERVFTALGVNKAV